MLFKKGQYIVNRQRWYETILGKKFYIDFTECVLLAKDWDNTSNKPIPYINYWSVDYLPRSKKKFDIKSLNRKYDDLIGGSISTRGNWYLAPKYLIQACEKSMQECIDNITQVFNWIKEHKEYTWEPYQGHLGLMKNKTEYTGFFKCEDYPLAIFDETQEKWISNIDEFLIDINFFQKP